MVGVVPPPQLSIIIVTWNGKRYALECLESLYSHPAAVSTEIIVVDNASTDGTPDAIRERFPEVTVLRNKDNLGFARANNIGIRASHGQYVCLINSDVVVSDGCLEKLIGALQAHTNIGIIGPKMRCPDGTIGLSIMQYPTVWNTLCAALAVNSMLPKSRLFAGFSISSEAIDDLRDVEVVTGWLWMTSRRALEQVGGLDERFFMYGEDIDWCYRFRKVGWRVVFAGQTEALHFGGASSSSAPARYYVEMRSANRQYFRKHHGVWGATGYTMTIAVHEVCRIFGHSLSYCCRRSKRHEAARKVRRSALCLLWLVGGKSLVAKVVGEPG